MPPDEDPALPDGDYPKPLKPKEDDTEPKHPYGTDR